MTEKELKKLSRLELLELLLDVSKENELLKERIKKLNAEIATQQKIEQLSTAIQQVEQALEHTSQLSANINTPLSVAECPDSQWLDKEIYRRLLQLYTENVEHLVALPYELRVAVLERAVIVLNENT